LKAGLAKIQYFLQQIVEAIATAIGVEVMIFDAERNIVAGTGETRVQVGSRYNTGSLTGRLLASGQPLVARSPGHSPECIPCSKYGTCSRRVVVAYPVKYGEKVLGSFCLVALDDEQRNRILANEKNLLHFLDRMCLLVRSAIGENSAREEIGHLLKRYHSVINSLHEGIIATDDTLRIIHINRSAGDLIGITAEEAEGRPINVLFPSLAGELSGDGMKALETEVYFQHKGKKRYLLASVVPVRDEGSGQFRGLTVSLKNLSEIQSYATRLMGDYSQYSFEQILGKTRGIEQVKERLKKAALTDSTILIRGESGTGKELFAHAVHRASHRRGGPFVAINCSAIPESLLESELFGYEEGAFTGAQKGGKPGKFELAGGGTLFLDEIGDMQLHLQSKLLRVLENRSLDRVGGTGPTPVNVRIIAATNRNLEEMVERHEFRNDLYFRLSVIPVTIPPLRDRRDDIPVIVKHFLDQYCAKMGRLGQAVGSRTMDLLMRYDWPGNVRELHNSIEYAISMSEPGQTINEDHLPQRVLSAAGGANLSDYQSLKRKIKNDPAVPSGAGQIGGGSAIPCGDGGPTAGPVFGGREMNLIRAMEAEAIRHALSMYGMTTAGKEKAARHLGISLSTLYRRIKEIDFDHIKPQHR